MGLVEAKVTSLWSSGDDYHYEITYTISGSVLAVDNYSSGGVTADLAIRDMVRNKCATLEADAARIGNVERIQLDEIISSATFEPKIIS